MISDVKKTYGHFEMMGCLVVHNPNKATPVSLHSTLGRQPVAPGSLRSSLGRDDPEDDPEENCNTTSSAHTLDALRQPRYSAVDRIHTWYSLELVSPRYCLRCSICLNGLSNLPSQAHQSIYLAYS